MTKTQNQHKTEIVYEALGQSGKLTSKMEWYSLKMMVCYQHTVLKPASLII